MQEVKVNQYLLEIYLKNNLIMEVKIYQIYK
jgi:hypothetical protein